MAVKGLAFSCRSKIPLQNHLFQCVRKVWPCSVAAIEPFEEAEDLSRDNNFPNLVHQRGDNNLHNLIHETGNGLVEWKKLNSKELGISTSTISRPTKKVLDTLQKKGYEVYLVGGCVRDLLLKRTPKDFDIITSAELREVKKAFAWCEIVGKRFPICHVHINDSIVEVSSFSSRQNIVGGDVHHQFVEPTGYDEKDYGRWRDCLRRDFTINSLMFDPDTSIVYDYLGGIEDLQKAKVRTVIPASISFKEDCARILRAIRIAARLGFRISRETAHFVRVLSGSVARLDKGRLLMETNYMLAYGSAEASLRLLWKYGLLEILLPFQAAYFVRSGFRRRDKRSNMLLSLFSNMDKLLAPDKPCHSSLWVAILAFHKALFDEPRDPLVVAAFSLAVHNGGNVAAAVQIARGITSLHDASYHELLEPESLESQEITDEVMDLADCVKCALSYMTDERAVSQAMAEYPKAPFSDLVLLPLGLYLRVSSIFECVRHGEAHGFVSKQVGEINYKALAMGALEEVRHVFARIVFDTMYPLKLTSDCT